MVTLNDNIPLENIKSSITEQQDTSKININFQLHDGTWVEERFYKRILLQVQKIVSALDPDCVYTAEQLCGKEFWDLLEKGERIQTGRCVVHMVKESRIPLIFTGKSVSNSRLYKLK